MTRRVSLLCAVVLALTVVLAAVPAFAAETVHMVLKVDGQVVKGDSTQASMGRADTIECIAFEQAVVVSENEKQYAPIKCTKRVDKSSPLLMKALAEKRPIEATFLFYRPNPSGDGTTQQFFTITIAKAKVTGYRVYVPETINPATSNLPVMEEVLFTYEAITWTYVPTNTTFSDSGKAIRQ